MNNKERISSLEQLKKHFNTEGLEPRENPNKKHIDPKYVVDSEMPETLGEGTVQKIIREHDERVYGYYDEEEHKSRRR